MSIPACLVPVSRSDVHVLDDFLDYSSCSIHSDSGDYVVDLGSDWSRMREGLFLVEACWVGSRLKKPEESGESEEQGEGGESEENADKIGSGAFSTAFAVSPTKICLSEHAALPGDLFDSEFEGNVTTAISESMLYYLSFTSFHDVIDSSLVFLPAFSSEREEEGEGNEDERNELHVTVRCTPGPSPTSPVQLTVSFFSDVRLSPFSPSLLFDRNFEHRMPLFFNVPPEAIRVCNRYAEAFRKANPTVTGERFFDLMKILRDEFHFVASSIPHPPHISLFSGFLHPLSPQEVTPAVVRCLNSDVQDTIAYLLGEEVHFRLIRDFVEPINSMLDEIELTSAGFVNFDFSSFTEHSFEDMFYEKFPFRMDAPYRLVPQSPEVPLSSLILSTAMDPAVFPLVHFFFPETFLLTPRARTTTAKKFSLLKRLLTRDPTHAELRPLMQIIRDSVVSCAVSASPLLLLEEKIALLPAETLGRLLEDDKFYIESSKILILRDCILGLLSTLSSQITLLLELAFRSHPACSGKRPVLIPGRRVMTRGPGLRPIPLTESVQFPEPSSSVLEDAPCRFVTTHLFSQGSSGSPIFFSPGSSNYPVVFGVAQSSVTSSNRPLSNVVQTFSDPRLEFGPGAAMHEAWLRDHKELEADWKRYLDQEGHSPEEETRVEFGRALLEQSVQFELYWIPDDGGNRETRVVEFAPEIPETAGKDLPE